MEPELDVTEEPTFAEYISERTRLFTGRTWLFAEIDRWLVDSSAPSTFILTGEPGVGKTAVSSRLFQFSQGIIAAPEMYTGLGRDFLSAVHFCDARRGGLISPERFTRSLSVQLAKRYKAFADALPVDPRIVIHQKIGTNYGTAIAANITNYYAEGPESLFEALVRRPLRTMLRRSTFSRPLLILIDALDEALSYSGRESIADLLIRCGDLPPTARLLITCRRKGDLVERFEPLKTHVRLLQVQEDGNRRDTYAYTTRRLQTTVCHEQLEEVVQRVTRSCADNFLVLGKVVDAIERGDLNAANPEDLPATLFEVFRFFFQRLVRPNSHDWRNRFRPLLGTLAVALEPIDAVTVCQWSGLDEESTNDGVHDLQEFLDPTLGDRYRIYHNSVVDFLCDPRSRPYNINPRTYHQRIIHSYAHALSPDGDAYYVRYLPEHLYVAKEYGKLVELVCNLRWYEAKQRVVPESARERYSAELENAWRSAEVINREDAQRGHSTSVLAAEVYSALAIVSLRSLPLPPAMLSALVEFGWWSVSQALSVARQLLDIDQKVRAICALVPFVRLSDERDEVLEEAFSEAGKAAWPWSRAELRFALAAHLGDKRRPQIQRETFEGMLQIREPWLRTDTLSAVAHLLPSAFLGSALAAADQIESPHNQQKLLAALLPYLSGDQKAEAIDRWKQSEVEFAAALHAAEISVLPDAERPKAIRKVLAEASDVHDPFWKATLI